MTQKPHNFRSKLTKKRIAISLLIFAVLYTSAYATPKVVIISLDGATPRIVDQLNANGQLNANEGINLLRAKGFSALQNVTIAPSLTAPAHIAIATGSIAAANDVVANTFHLVASPFTFNISGFSAPIGGYLIDGPAQSPELTAVPLWRPLLENNKTVATATWPGGDGLNITVPGRIPIVQPAEERTVTYTVPFGSATPPFQKGFPLDAASFTPAPDQIVDDLNTAGHTSYSPVLQANLETFSSGGQSYSIKIAALDTTNDSTTNYDTLVMFDANHGSILGPFTAAPLGTGPAYIQPSTKISALFYLEGHSNKAGVRYFVSQLAPDLSTVRIARSSTSFIPRNAAVLADVDDINNNVGFWQPQADFRIVERIDAVPSTFASFPNIELEAIYEELVREFVTYQTNVGLRAISRFPNVDLAMIYIEQPDGSEHQFLAIDPRQATNPTDPNSIGQNQDPAKLARYRNYIASAYQVANQAVQRVINAVGIDANGVPNSNILVVSDHGFDAFHTAVNANAFLTANGFDTNKVRAVSSGPAVNFYINLQGREPNGTVTRMEYLALQQQLFNVLQNVTDTNPNYTNGTTPVFDKIYTRPVPDDINDPQFGRLTNDFIGQDSGDVFAMLRIGYNFDGVQNPVVIRKDDPMVTNPVLSVANFYGAHGYDPTISNMSAIFFAAGPDIGRGTLRQIQTVDIAPTILKLLGVAAPSTVDGKALAVRLPKNLLTTLRDQLAALSGDPETQLRYNNAINALNRGIDSNAWTDGSHLGENSSIVFASIATAARQLLQIHNPSPSVTAIVAALADAARELAQIAIDQAVVANVNPQQIAAAQQMIQQGDASIASGDFVSAIQFFQHAWQRASQR
jgi:predicted AlkP superfamily pyrophosphatase or phosphodiesterase